MSHALRGQSFVGTKKSLVVVALFVVLAAALLAGTVATESNASKETGESQPRSARKACCTDDFDKLHLLAASYYSVKDNYRSNLMLNNKGPDPVEVRPSLFALNGNRMDAPPIIVPGESFRNVDLVELGAISGTIFEEGSLQLVHKGPDLVIGAQLYIVNESRSLSLDEKLVEFPGVPSNQLEGVWWMAPHSDVDLILSNTSDSSVNAEVKVIAEPITVTLSAHETRKIRLSQEGRGWSKNNYGGASITHSGPKGALIARVLTTGRDSGYSFSTQFYYPQGAKSAGYQGVGLRLEKVAGHRLEAFVIARNVGQDPSLLSGRVTYTTANGDTDVVQLPPQNLGPGEVALVDVDRPARRVVEQKSVVSAGLEFEYWTPPGSVIMVAQSVSSDRNQQLCVFHVLSKQL